VQQAQCTRIAAIQYQHIIAGNWENDIITGSAVKTTTSNSNKCVVLFENGMDDVWRAMYHA
jgi:hypothetical protein